MADSDLYIDNDVLERTRASLANINAILNDPGDTVQQWGTNSAGVDELSARLGEFDDEWEYGIGKIKEFADGAAETLGMIMTAFENYDLDLAKQLREAG